MAVTSSAENTITVRRGCLIDLHDIMVIERAAFGRHALDPSTLFWLLLRRWPGFLVAEASGKIVGYIITRIPIWPLWNRVGGITSLAVKPERMRQGVGRSLMLAALKFLRESHVVSVDLEVSLKNIPAITLYKSLGFTSGKLFPDYYGAGDDGMKMTMSL